MKLYIKSATTHHSLGYAKWHDFLTKHYSGKFIPKDKAGMEAFAQKVGIKRVKELDECIKEMLQTGEIEEAKSGKRYVIYGF